MNLNVVSIHPGKHSAVPAGVAPAAAPSGRAPREAPATPSAQVLGAAIEAINQSAQKLNSSVQFSLDTRSKQPIVRVVDNETGQLIRQIPTEEVLEIRQALDRIVGLLIHQTA